MWGKKTAVVEMEMNHSSKWYMNHSRGVLSLATMKLLAIEIWDIKSPGWWARATPLNNMSSSIGMMNATLYIHGKIKFMATSHHQPDNYIDGNMIGMGEWDHY